MLGLKEGDPRFSVDSFLYHSTETFRRATFLCRVSEKSVSEKVYGKEEGGVSTISVENFLSHSAENFRKGTL